MILQWWKNMVIKYILYEGDYTNIKITTPEDLILAERLIN